MGYLITLSETNTNWGRGGGTGRVNPKSLQFIEKKQGGDTIIFKSSFFFLILPSTIFRQRRKKFKHFVIKVIRKISCTSRN